MRALTIHQPWASLIAFGEKTIETRGWSTKYRGPLLIHAGKTQMFTRTMRRHAPHPIPFLLRRCRVGDWSLLPHGAVVAIADLVDVLPGDDALREYDHPQFECDLGSYGPGRFGWVLANVRPLSSAVPANGRQGLWVPADKLFEAAEAHTQKPLFGWHR